MKNYEMQSYTGCPKKCPLRIFKLFLNSKISCIYTSFKKMEFSGNFRKTACPKAPGIKKLFFNNFFVVVHILQTILVVDLTFYFEFLDVEFMDKIVLIFS